ncbi:MAG: SMC-Scp complex subunit ScpB [Candidatus Bipolaricaulia bacterium]
MDDADRGNDLAVVEAALFLATHPLTRRALAKILDNVPLAYVDRLLDDLREIYADSARGIELRIEDGRAMLRVKSAYVERVAHLAPQQDIPQPVLRTLAVIAYNHPVTQADVVRVRGNKAYEHIKELEERGLVRGEEQGRTVLLSVTEDFLRHFGLSTIEEFRFHAADVPSVQEAQSPEAAASGPLEQEVGDGQDS